MNNGLDPKSNDPAPFLDEAPQEEERHLRDYLRVLLRRKWIVITFFLVVATTGIVATYLATPIYRSSVTLKIENENPYITLFKDNIAYYQGSEDYMQTQYLVLRSKALAKRVARAMGLDKEQEEGTNPKPSKTDGQEDPDILSRPLEQDVIPRGTYTILGGVSVSPIPRTRMVAVSFDSPDPKFAALAANEIARSYIQFNVEMKFNATQQARDWLEKQLADMRAKVERSEETLNRHAAENRIIKIYEDRAAAITNGSGKEQGNGGQNQPGPYDRLDLLTNEMNKAISERIGRELVLREAKQGDFQLVSAVSGNPQVQALRTAYTQKELEYSNLSLTYKPEHPKMVKLKEEMNILKNQIEIEAKAALVGMRKEYEVAVNRENFYRAALDEYKRETLTTTDKMVQYQILKRDADTNRELYNGILQRLKETGISANMTTSNVQILDRAEVPGNPYKPDKRKNILMAVLFGLFGGLGLAFFVDYLDNTLKSPDDVEKKISLPSLGIVPKVSLKDVVESRAKTLMVSLDDKSSSLLEAYRSITTYIQFSSPVRPPKVIVVSSARRDEGKSTTCINLAITQSSSYGKTILIDADLRKPQMHKIFSVDNAHGLSSYLTGQVDFGAEGLVQPTNIPNLDVITAGVIPPNPSELLSSYRMKELIDQLSPLYSFILIDTPPVLGLSDSLVLSTIADGLILVVRAGSTPKDSVNQAKRLLKGVNAHILGVVLNYVRESDLRYGSYGYYYSYYYYEEDDGTAKKKKRKKHRKGQDNREVA